MIPLLFILIVTGISVMVSYEFSEEITWFTYYKGIVAGLLVSSVLLEIWTRRRKAKEEKQKEKR